MTNYKITNLKTKAVYFLTEPQKDQFFRINSFYDSKTKKDNYKIQNVQNIKNAKFNKKLENILFTVIGVCLMTAMYLGLCELLAFIDRITLTLN
jgi:hypothetical protein